MELSITHTLIVIFMEDTITMLYYVTQRSIVPAKYTCPSGWTTEYYRYLMAQYYLHHPSSLHVLHDKAFKISKWISNTC